jgi:hypothetical protein
MAKRVRGHSGEASGVGHNHDLKRMVADLSQTGEAERQGLGSPT